MARQPLGRGLSALLGENPAVAVDGAPYAAPNEVDIDQLEPNPEQPRGRFTESALDDLAASIKGNGIVQPIVVRRRGDRYQIVAGERRWRAAQRAGLRKVPVTVSEIADERLLEVALIENIQRQELSPIEEAKAYRKLLESTGYTQEQLAERVGKERSVLTTALRILKLPPDIQDLIDEGKLSAGHGRSLLMSEDVSVQRRVAKAVIESGLSVRDSERLIKSSAASDKIRAERRNSTQSKDANVRLAETKLMRSLGTNVKISPNAQGEGGRIEIEYYSSSDLDRLYQLIMNSKEG